MKDVPPLFPIALVMPAIVFAGDAMDFHQAEKPNLEDRQVTLSNCDSTSPPHFPIQDFELPLSQGQNTGMNTPQPPTKHFDTQENKDEPKGRVATDSTLTTKDKDANDANGDEKDVSEKRVNTDDTQKDNDEIHRKADNPDSKWTSNGKQDPEVGKKEVSDAKTNGAKSLKQTLAAVALAAMAVGGGCAIYRYLHTGDCSVFRIPETSVAYAARNLENLFKSAQQTFIHRNGKRMGASIEELGEHFTIGSNGTIIYREIWYARYGRPESDITPVAKQDDWERKALADPYRYAVLPVHGFESLELDDRTSVLVAIPVSGKNVPGLLVVAGPVRNDPADFLRKWPVKRIVTPEGCQLLRDRIDAKKPYDPAFAEELSPHFEEDF